MCRYSDHQYPEHFVCVSCRVSCKGEFDQPGAERRCPHCAVPMIAMGLDFKAPRKDATLQWRKLALLVADGVRFSSCGCGGPGPRPRTFAAAKAASATGGERSAMMP